MWQYTHVNVELFFREVLMKCNTHMKSMTLTEETQIIMRHRHIITHKIINMHMRSVMHNQHHNRMKMSFNNYF